MCIVYGTKHVQHIIAGSKCSLLDEGAMVPEDAVGCGGGIKMRCRGGCLKILKTLYSCERKEVSIEEQLEIVQDLCEEKEECTVEASREVFGNSECPDSADRDMNLWVTYRCDGGEDETQVTGPRRCTSTKG